MSFQHPPPIATPIATPTFHPRGDRVQRVLPEFAALGQALTILHQGLTLPWMIPKPVVKYEDL